MNLGSSVSKFLFRIRQVSFLFLSAYFMNINMVTYWMLIGVFIVICSLLLLDLVCAQIDLGMALVSFFYELEMSGISSVLLVCSNPPTYCLAILFIY